MGWYKKNNYKDISKKIKEILKNHPFTTKLVNDYNLTAEEIDDNLKIEIKELQGRFAEGNGNKMVIDPKILEKDFFKNNFHFVIHEFFHWVKRRNERKYYFKDKEEIQSFILAITWEILNGKNKKDIFETMLPLIEPHFKDKETSLSFLKELFEKSLVLYNYYLENK